MLSLSGATAAPSGLSSADGTPYTVRLSPTPRRGSASRRASNPSDGLRSADGAWLSFVKRHPELTRWRHRELTPLRVEFWPLVTSHPHQSTRGGGCGGCESCG